MRQGLYQVVILSRSKAMPFDEAIELENFVRRQIIDSFVWKSHITIENNIAGSGSQSPVLPTPPDDSPPIEELGLSPRVYRRLKRRNINTLGRLASKSECGILRIPGLGRLALVEVREKLAARNLFLGEDSSLDQEVDLTAETPSAGEDTKG
jgi:DNA-directed RNA polymerase alpha subunit